MDFGYRLKKRWAGFKQKYNLRAQSRNIRKLFIFLFVVWIFGSVLTILTQWAFASEFHAQSTDYIKYFWVVIIELVSGFDIPGDVPLHYISQVITVFMLIMGIIAVGLLTGQIISIFLYVLQRNEYLPEKPNGFRFRRPILICGSNPGLFNIVRHLRADPKSSNREIVIIDSDADQIKKPASEFFEDVWFLKGDPADRRVLEQVLGDLDNRVIILPQKDSAQKYSDSRSINTALAIQSYDKKRLPADGPDAAHKDIHIYTVVEVLDPESRNHFKCTSVNEWLHVPEFEFKLISQSALQPGLSKIFTQFLGLHKNGDSNSQIYFSKDALPELFLGKSFREIHKLFITKFAFLNITLIGFAKYISPELKKELNLSLRNSCFFTQINPVSAPDNLRQAEYIRKNKKILYTKETRITKNDKLIYLAEQEIDFNQITFK